jgi:FMN phosphatase YigB (HAD superfamily)
MNSPPTAVLPLASGGSEVPAREGHATRGSSPELKLLRDHHEVLSLDVYDTALQRPFVSPIHLFGEVESHVRRIHGVKASRGLARLRIEAERRARGEQEALLQAGNSEREDIRYADIERHLRLLRDPADPAALEAFFAQELLLERTRVRANPEILALFTAAKQGGRRVGFVSEMYLPGEVIADALRGAGYAEWDFLHVSSETGSLKRTQSAFRHLLSHTGREPARILHVGDHPAADCAAPRALGIDAHPFRPRYWCGPNHGEVTSGTELVSQELKAAYPGDDAYAALAAPDRMRVIGRMLGPLLVYPWVRWLLQRVRHDNLGELHFLGRDGHLVNQIIGVWAPHQGIHLRSRQLPMTGPSLCLATFPWASPQLFHHLCAGLEDEGGPGLLRRLALNRGNLPLRCRWHPIWGVKPPFRSAWHQRQLRKAFLALGPSVAAALREQHAATLAALQPARPRSPASQGIGLVDLGWDGALQAALDALPLSDEERTVRSRLHGYSYGLLAGACPHTGEQRQPGSNHGHFVVLESNGASGRQPRRLLTPLLEICLRQPVEDPDLLAAARGSLHPSHAGELHAQAELIAALQEGILLSCQPASAAVQRVEQWLQRTDSAGSELVAATLELIRHSLPRPLCTDLGGLRHRDECPPASPGIRLDQHPAMPWRKPSTTQSLVRRVRRRLRALLAR